MDDAEIEIRSAVVDLLRFLSRGEASHERKERVRELVRAAVEEIRKDGTKKGDSACASMSHD